VINIRADGKSNSKTKTRIMLPQNNRIIYFCRSKLKNTWEEYRNSKMDNALRT
jgi:hypothetical protein